MLVQIPGVREQLRRGITEAADYAELARLAHVSRARITQIMNLTLLAPDIQEAILFLPRANGGKASIRERHIRPISAVADRHRRGRVWDGLVSFRDRATDDATRR